MLGRHLRMRFNADEPLRRLEREYAESHDRDVRLRLIQERLRRGPITPMHVQLAAALGDSEAKAIGLPKLKVAFTRQEHVRAAHRSQSHGVLESGPILGRPPK